MYRFYGYELFVFCIYIQTYYRLIQLWTIHKYNNYIPIIAPNFISHSFIFSYETAMRVEYPPQSFLGSLPFLGRNMLYIQIAYTGFLTC